MPPTVIFIFIGFVALIIVGAILGAKANAKRLEALRAFAKDHGFRFSEARDFNIERDYPEFDFLRRGDDRYAFNRFDGEYGGRPLVAFEYHYETSSRDKDGNRTTTDHYFSAAVLHSSFPLKSLDIRPEGFVDRIAGAFGWDDIDFESAEFSRRYHVKAPDRKWAYDILHARAIESILAFPKRYTINFARNCVAITTDRRWDHLEILDATKSLTTLLDSIPDYVIRQQNDLASS